MAMDIRATVLLVAGLLFPILSAVTGAVSVAVSWRTGRHVFPIFVPFIGPTLLVGWLLRRGVPVWALLMPWVTDIGTLAFLLAAPRLAREWWETSLLTRVAILAGKHGSAEATVSLHRSGRYFLRKEWQRSPGEFGILGMGELGDFEWQDTDLRLLRDGGGCRSLRPSDDGFCVDEDRDFGEASLRGWILNRKAKQVAPADARKDALG